MNRYRIAFFITLALLVLPLIGGCTIVPIAEVQAVKQSETFDPSAYVDGIWDEQVVPAILEKAHDLPTVLQAIETDLTAAGEQYATISQSGALNFVVRGQATVATVDTESRNGTAILTPDGYSGATTIVMQIGPLVRGDSVRDGVGFISFGDFKDQTEFGQVSKELNRRVSEGVLAGIDLTTLAGKSISFDGVFTIRTVNQTNIDLSEITITPVILDVQE
jgi:predicted lipoprotein